MHCNEEFAVSDAVVSVHSSRVKTTGHITKLQKFRYFFNFRFFTILIESFFVFLFTFVVICTIINIQKEI